MVFIHWTSNMDNLHESLFGLHMKANSTNVKSNFGIRGVHVSIEEKYTAPDNTYIITR